MPLYEYTCQKCHRDFELLVRAERDPGMPVLRQPAAAEAVERSGGPCRRRHEMPTARPRPPGGCGMGQCGMGGCGLGPCSAAEPRSGTRQRLGLRSARAGRDAVATDRKSLRPVGRIATWTTVPSPPHARYSRSSRSSRSKPPDRIGNRHQVLGSRFSSSRWNDGA